MQAFKGVNLAINQGRLPLDRRPVGSGKSTLLNILGLLDRQTVGRLPPRGRATPGARRPRAAPACAARGIGFIFQSFHLLPQPDVIENVMLAELYVGAPRRGPAGPRHAALDRVGMTDRAEFLPTRSRAASSSAPPSPAR